VTASTDGDESMVRNCIDQVCLVFLLSNRSLVTISAWGSIGPHYEGKAVYFKGCTYYQWLVLNFPACNHMYVTMPCR
jgi:hypothetical protein